MAGVAVNFAKDHEKLVVLGGVYNGQLLDVAGVTTLAKLPSLDELRGKLVGMLNAGDRIAGVLKHQQASWRVIGAYAAGDQAA